MLFYSTIKSTFIAAEYAKENNELLKELVEREPVRIEYVVPIQEDEEYQTSANTIIATVPQEEQTEETDAVERVVESEQSADKTSASFGKEIGQNVSLPNLPTDRKVCTNYTVYGIKGTPHNRMQLAAYTDVLGCRRYGEYYIVGLGSAYADRIGETFEVELETGVIFKIITGDMKADCDTDETNRYCPCMNYNGGLCANILEFIVDKSIMDKAAYRWGGVDYYDKFKGNIVRMTYLGRDTSADWDTYL